MWDIPRRQGIYEVVGKARGVYQMSMTMWNFPIQIAKLQIVACFGRTVFLLD
jgi:hypothetical protein